MSPTKKFIVNTQSMLDALDALLSISKQCEFIHTAVMRAIPEFDPKKAKFRKVDGSLVMGLLSFDCIFYHSDPQCSEVLEEIKSVIDHTYANYEPGPLHKRSWFVWLTILTNFAYHLKNNGLRNILIDEEYFCRGDAENFDDLAKLEAGHISLAFIYVIDKAFEDMSVYKGFEDKHELPHAIWSNLPSIQDPMFTEFLGLVAPMIGFDTWENLSSPLTYVRTVAGISDTDLNTPFEWTKRRLRDESSRDIFSLRPVLDRLENSNKSGVTVEQSLYASRIKDYLSDIRYFVSQDKPENTDKNLCLGFALKEFIEKTAILSTSARGVMLLFILCETISNDDEFFSNVRRIRRPDISFADISYGCRLK